MQCKAMKTTGSTVGLPGSPLNCSATVHSMQNFDFKKGARCTLAAVHNDELSYSRSGSIAWRHSVVCGDYKYCIQACCPLSMTVESRAVSAQGQDRVGDKTWQRGVHIRSSAGQSSAQQLKAQQNKAPHSGLDIGYFGMLELAMDVVDCVSLCMQLPVALHAGLSLPLLSLQQLCAIPPAALQP